MIITRISAGLGNQLFQYATARAISVKLNRKLFLDNSWYDNIKSIEDYSNPNATTIRYFLLNYFNIQSRAINKIHLNWIKRLEIRSKNSKVYKFLLDGPLNNFSYTTINNDNFSLEFIQEHPHVYLTGYWQNNDIIEEYKYLLYNDLILKHPLSVNNQTYLKSINSTNSVAIHFRRGDYQSKPKSRDVHASCSNNYYYEGIEYLRNKINNLHYFIFSDDKTWVKNNLDFNAGTTFIDNDGPNYEHLYLMSQCKHQITANSTFSWWAAWLNKNTEKIIVTPKYWYINKHLNETVIRIPNKWIKIDNLA
ncbi:MAG: alpha-1,2-fucosyltransferase [Candidatus Marinimicrobia bacterium]|nr:alpha-1,2-fucosyltransferase [Candidatus Neomarinimicrobiota bacterium]